jgi:photosystem II stability/assembly factor-like uncharacterized protein
LNTGYVIAQFHYDEGTNPGIMKTVDGGKTWDTLLTRYNCTFNGIDISENGTIFVDIYLYPSNESLILRSFDEGKTWEETWFQNSYIRSIDFIDNNTGISAGRNIYKTTDGGDNWFELFDSGFQSTTFYDFKFLKGTETGILVGDNFGTGVIFKTADFGRSWIKTLVIPYPSNYNLQAVQAQSSDNWFVCGGWTSAVLLNTTNGGTVGLSGNQTIVPEKYSLYQNYPNPFNPSTSIKFDIPESDKVRLVIFDMTGKEIGELVNEKLEAGTYEYNFDASSLSSGVYFYRLESGNLSFSKRMMLIK